MICVKESSSEEESSSKGEEEERINFQAFTSNNLHPRDNLLSTFSEPLSFFTPKSNRQTSDHIFKNQEKGKCIESKVLYGFSL